MIIKKLLKTTNPEEANKINNYVYTEKISKNIALDPGTKKTELTEDIERMLNSVARCSSMSKEHLKHLIYEEVRVYNLKEDIKDYLYNHNVHYDNQMIDIISTIYDKVEDCNHSYWDNIECAYKQFSLNYTKKGIDPEDEEELKLWK